MRNQLDQACGRREHALSRAPRAVAANPRQEANALQNGPTLSATMWKKPGLYCIMSMLRVLLIS